jgi:hypothetical protein
MVNWNNINTPLKFWYLIEAVGSFHVTSQKLLAMRR